ncbi:outer membrane lipoprotein-sorting protein [Paraburkholderia sp. CNPSo 3272]|uniref:outer membrane lipoprotein-sorting protein n=1 Tax=Paraburkholderia sp. CNPSo 3272 TaxID=2940931 RepID=UPI0020B75BE8|nr:outer membrane lipoprotein-sorting protein [Paraburkholderia sp. CNPSo 3272]MCP3723218.1 outer membrane lipoprotein-sorting protein [Paraburkholderia sp. CNPSo 3272]
MNRLLSLAIRTASVVTLVASAPFALAGSSAASAQTAGAAHMSAAQIVERNVAARGGLQAWHAVNAMTMSGQLEAGGTKNTKLPFTMTLKRPRKSRIEVRFNDQTAFQVYDGAQGWKVRPFLGRNEAEPYTPAEARAAASWAELDGPLMDYAAKGTRIDVLGMEMVEGHRAYLLKLTLKDGTSRRVWIDAASFLELKIDGDPRKLDGKMHNVAIFYRDYRKEGGLVMPHTLETVVVGARGTHKLIIDKVALNPQADDTLFAKPQLTVSKVTHPAPVVSANPGPSASPNPSPRPAASANPGANAGAHAGTRQSASH